MERSLDTLARDDLGAKPYRSIAGDAATGLLILCDHAENSLPEPYGLLGLRPEDLHRHIAYDMGAAGVAERLAEMLGAPALLSRFSRLLIDPNRGLDDPTLIMQISDGLIVPGNVGLDENEVASRIALYYEPYHRAIERAVEAGLAAGKPPVIVSVHSFTQAWKGVPRPWSVGVLWDKDPRLALPLLEALRDHSRHRGRRQRALFRTAQGRHALPSRHGARACSRADRGPPGPDPERGGPGRMGRASGGGIAHGDARGKRAACDRAARLSYRRRERRSGRGQCPARLGRRSWTRRRAPSSRLRPSGGSSRIFAREAMSRIST